MYLDRVHQDLKLFPQSSLRGDSWTLEQIFQNLRKLSRFLMVFILFWDTVSIISILPSEAPIQALKTNDSLKFYNFLTTKAKTALVVKNL